MCAAVSPLDAPRRRVTDVGEPTNRDILDKMEAFVNEHRRDHTALDARLAAHDTAAALRETHIAALERVATEIGPLRDFRIQVQTIGASVKWVLGGSLLAALASIAALVATFAHMLQGGLS